MLQQYFTTLHATAILYYTIRYSNTLFSLQEALFNTVSTVSKLHWQWLKLSVLASKFPGDHNENLLIVIQSTAVVVSLRM